MLTVKTIIFHMIFGIIGSVSLLASAVMFVLKLAEIGSGPSLDWNIIIGATALGVLMFVIDAFVVLGAAKSRF